MIRRYAILAILSGSLVCWTALPSSLRAQSSATAQLAGEIKDPSGSVVAGAAVQLTETDRNTVYTATSDKTGHYTLPGLQVGAYRLEVDSAGFKKYVQKSIVLHVGDNREISVSLALGENSETVEVVAGANLVQTEQTSVSQIISTKSIVELPLNGRQATQLVLISGASVVAPSGDITSSKNYPSSTSISVAGGQANGTNYLLDGGTNIDTFTNVNLPFPFPDALVEFSVDANALPARNGYQPGGLVTVVTKSGANKLHGDAFEFLRNGAVNARNYFSTTPDALKRNQFGGTVGGRVIKDKLFFFAGYQGTRTITAPSNTIVYVPTAAELAGNFSIQESATCQTSGKAHAPLNGYPTNQIPTSQFDPAALKTVGYLPKSSDPCGKTTFPIKLVLNEDQYIGRGDLNLSSRHSLFARFFHAQYNAPGAYDPTNLLVAAAPGQQQTVSALTMGDFYTVGSSLVNSFHATATHRGEVRGNSPLVINPNTAGVNVYAAIPNDFHVTVGSDFQLGCGTCSTATYGDTTWEFSDDIDYIKGRHHIGFGASYLRTDDNVNGAYLSNGQYGFNGFLTGEVMADFLLGAMSSFSQSRALQLALRDSIVSPYVQDTWRLNPHLVINAGVRWEPHVFAHDFFHRGGGFSLANFQSGTVSTVYPTAPAGAIYPGDPGITDTFANTNWTNISPRLGIVWDISGKGLETLRAGGGIMYDSPEEFALSQLLNDPPFTNRIDLLTSAKGGFSNPYTTGYNYPGGNPFPVKGTYFPQFASYSFTPAKLKNTKMNQWNVTYQKQLGENWVISASYIGNRTNHVWGATETNPSVYIPAACPAAAATCTVGTNQRRVLYLANPGPGKYYGSVLRINDGSNASYNGLLISANHRLTHGASLLANYTWSHCISGADYLGDQASSSFMNPANPGLDKAACGFDVRHIANFSVVDTLRVPGHSMFSRAVGAWQFAPLVRATSGIPLNVLTGSDVSRTGVGLDRPNYDGITPVYATTGGKTQRFSKAGFSPAPVGSFGNVGRNALRGPGAITGDLAATRIFNLPRESSMEFRVEAFNVVNHVNLLAPSLATGIPGITTAGISLNLNSATFGKITTAGDPRILQAAVKILF